MKRKDYKQGLSTNEKARHSSGLSKGFAPGLGLGLVVALSVHIYHASQPEVANLPLPSAPPVATTNEESPPSKPTSDDPMKIKDEDITNILLNTEVRVPTSHNQYILQAGSFRTQEEAQALERKILAHGHKPLIYDFKKDNVVWHSVRLGPFLELGSANEVRMRLKVYGIETSVKHHQE